jgi:hypothetical protein
MRKRHATPISRGFEDTRGIDGMTGAELVTFAHITRWAAIGCLHEGASALGAELMADANWLDAQIADWAAKAQRQ